MVTHKRLLYNSIQFVRALVRSTMMQQLVNTWLRQSALGISAVRFSFTWRCIQAANDGIARVLMISSAMVEAL